MRFHKLNRALVLRRSYRFNPPHLHRDALETLNKMTCTAHRLHISTLDISFQHAPYSGGGESVFEDGEVVANSIESDCFAVTATVTELLGVDGEVGANRPFV